MRIFFLIAVFFISDFSFASGDSGYGKITELYLNHVGGFVRIRFSQPIANPDGCQGEEYYIAELDDTVGSNRFYSALLSAYASQKKVKFWLNGCTTNAYWQKTRIKIYDIYMSDAS